MAVPLHWDCFKTCELQWLNSVKIANQKGRVFQSSHSLRSRTARCWPRGSKDTRAWYMNGVKLRAASSLN